MPQKQLAGLESQMNGAVTPRGKSSDAALTVRTEGLVDMKDETLDHDILDGIDVVDGVDVPGNRKCLGQADNDL